MIFVFDAKDASNTSQVLPLHALLTHSRRTTTLRCIDHATGDLQWKERGYGVGSVLLAGGRIIVLSDEGELLIVAPNADRFILIASAQVIEGKCWTPPVLCDGKLYIRNAEGRLICLDMRIGPAHSDGAGAKTSSAE